MKLVRLGFLVLLILFSSNVFSQKGLIPVLNVTGERGAWITDIHVVNSKVRLIDGIYMDDIIFGRDTLRDSDEGLNFVAQLEAGTVKRSTPCNGKILEVDQQFFCVVGNNGEGWDREVISKYDLRNNLIWTYTLSLAESGRATLYVTDICFDGLGNTYAIFSIDDGKGEVSLNNELVIGPAVVIVKFGKNGEILSFKILSKNSYTYTKLKIKGNKICAYAGEKHFYKAVVLDADLKEEIQDDKLKELCRYNVWDGKKAFKIEQDGLRPQRAYYLQKHNVKDEVTTRKELFRDTVRFQDEIYQHEVLNLNKKELLIAYVSRGKKDSVNIYNNQINIIIVRKNNLEIVKRFGIDCVRLSNNDPSDVAFQIYDGDLLIGNEYFAYTRIGGLEFANKDKTTKRPSFFVVRQPLD